MIEYFVALRLQYPAWDERDGIEYVVSASSKSQANKLARIEADRDGHVPAIGKGTAVFSARVRDR